MKLNKAQRRKLTEEIICIAFAVLGIVILVLNLMKIIPENSIIIAYIIAYGFLIGPAIAVLGFVAFLETRNIPVKKFRRKAR